jgi:phosphate starvation-inducible protein PhoH and related proteins
MNQTRISIKGVDPRELLGPRDEHLRMLEAAFQSKIVIRDDEAIVTGSAEESDVLKRVFTELLFLLNRNQRLDRRDVQTVIDLIRDGGGSVSRGAESNQAVVFYGKKGVIRPKTEGQQEYVQSVLKNDIVFAVGPAGTGKTYLAVAMALTQLREKAVSRIILTRPAIEAGESLGFLPGDLMEKVDPYLRPLTDALFDMMPSDQVQKSLERKIIEIVPLGYMRGRTLNDAFVILDEAQNTMPMQMKMFLTRLGFNSKAVITGDVTQVDLPEKTESGLIQIQKILKGIDGIGFVYLDKKDVVRHKLVKEIIRAYETFQGRKTGTEPE